MRVLLISPLRNLDPPCGDITYTETLLRNPPPGVEYETHASALAAGRLVEHANRRRFWREPVITGANKLINLARAKRWLFWEPFRYFSVSPGAYDVVHLHVFSAAFWKMDCPLVVTSGAPQTDLYVDRRGHSPARVSRMLRTERVLARMLGINSCTVALPQAARVAVYTTYYRDWLVSHGVIEREKIDVVPIMHEPDLRPIEPRVPMRIGFVAHDFNAKGGQVLLKAFQMVKSKVPRAELSIVGAGRPADVGEAEGVKWLGPIDRDRLLREVMPSFDVFAYPTPHDCFSYVMLEAMAAGCAIATSDYVSMPEAVDFGKAGMISPVGDSTKLAENIIALLDPQANLRFRLAARERFMEYFSCGAVGPKFLQTYQAAMAEAAATVRRGVTA